MQERWIALCVESELPVLPGSGALGFPLDADHGAILTCAGGRPRAFLNRCPHTGVSLDWMPGRLCDTSGVFLQCSTHGALFRRDDGYCVAGPCAGDRLTALPVRVHQGRVEVAWSPARSRR